MPTRRSPSAFLDIGTNDTINVTSPAVEMGQGGHTAMPMILIEELGGGYCQSGMMLAAVARLKQKPQPTDADIDTAMTNICRCGTYNRIRRAIHAAARRNPHV